MSGRGRVRFELLLEQVLDALPRPPASVADAGGGTGQLAVPLARLGYHVTVVDTSAAMLATCVDDPAAVLATLAEVLRPGGVLSLTFANRDWLVQRAGRHGDYPGALRLLDDAGASSPSRSPSHRAVTAAELDDQLAKAGFEVAAMYGVSVFAEGREDDLDRAALEALLELERRVAGREPYRSSAQVVHLVARRSLAARLHAGP